MEQELFRARQKRRIFEEWMEGDHVMVHLDARAKGVDVPPAMKGNSQLVLKLSYKFQGRTELSDTAIVSYLKFSGDYFRCVLPWGAIWGMTSESGEKKLWTEDLPKGLLSELSRLLRLSSIIGGKDAEGGQSSEVGAESHVTTPGDSKVPGAQKSSKGGRVSERPQLKDVSLPAGQDADGADASGQVPPALRAKPVLTEVSHPPTGPRSGPDTGRDTPASHPGAETRADTTKDDGPEDPAPENRPKPSLRRIK